MNSQELDKILEGLPRRLTPRQVAKILGKCPRTLRGWRREGIGPEFIRVGKFVKYNETAVFAWLEAQVHAGDGKRCATCGARVPASARPAVEGGRHEVR